MRYRRRAIEAVQFIEHRSDDLIKAFPEAKDWGMTFNRRERCWELGLPQEVGECEFVTALEGDWIIKGSSDLFSVCTDKIFKHMYEEEIG